MQRIIKRIETKRVKPWLYSEMQYARYKQFLKIKNSISPPLRGDTSLHAFSLITNVPLLFVPIYSFSPARGNRNLWKFH